MGSRRWAAPLLKGDWLWRSLEVLRPRQKGKTEPLLPTSAHQPKGGAQDAMIRHRGDGGGSLARRCGKVLIGVLGKFFYRPKSPSMSRTTSRIIPSTESKILEEFVANLT
jgi:hypothetical protein